MFRVLIVDDDFRVAQIHAAFVQRVPGFVAVGQAHSAAAAMEAIGRLAPQLILLDLYLPDEHGFEMLARLRQEESSVGVVVISAAKQPEDLRRAINLGAVHYLLKPFSFDVFRDKLNSYAAMHAQLAHLTGSIDDQSRVDEVFSALRGPGSVLRSLPKGLSLQTLEAVESVLEKSEAGLGAVQVAAEIGISRATAQRYLAYMESVGRVTNRPRYGTAGRPEHIYRPAELHLER